VEAAEALKKAHFVKFDETVDLVMNLGVDPKHSDQMVRGTVVLPHGLGKSKRVIVIATGEKFAKQKKPARILRGRRSRTENSRRLDGLRRGDRHAGHDESPPDASEKFWPSRSDAESEDRHGHIRYRKAVREIKPAKWNSAWISGIIHSPVGKISFDAHKLAENAQALLGAVVKAKLP